MAVHRPSPYRIAGRCLLILPLLLALVLAPLQDTRAAGGPGDKYQYLPVVMAPGKPVQPPGTPANPGPASGAVDQPTTLTLAWAGGGSGVTYTLRLDKVNPPKAVVASKLKSTSYKLSNLAPSTKYFWQVVATGSTGLTTAGPVWTFTTTNRPAPPASRLSTNELIYCAVTASGTVQCWGDPGVWAGRIIPDESNVPVTIPGLSGVKSVGVGDGFACVLTTGGGVKCWGNNISGQLGNGTEDPSATPVDVIGLTSGVAQIAVGDLFACALLNTGVVKCWGNNTNGQLGIGSLDNQPAPVQVVGLSGVSAIDLGSRHACAIASGAVHCWGSSEFFQVGSIRLNIFEFPLPEPVHGLSSGAIAIAAGTSHTCAVLSDGSAKCWGLNNGGELGIGYTGQGSLPENVVGLPATVSSIAPDTHTCAILSDGAAWCWGWNLEGELGRGEIFDYSVTPAPVEGLPGRVTEIATGVYSTCALLDNGRLMCWGSNADSQLGAGIDDDNSLVPVYVVGW